MPVYAYKGLERQGPQRRRHRRRRQPARARASSCAATASSRPTSTRGAQRPAPRDRSRAASASACGCFERVTAAGPGADDAPARDPGRRRPAAGRVPRRAGRAGRAAPRSKRILVAGARAGDRGRLARRRAARRTRGSSPTSTSTWCAPARRAARSTSCSIRLADYTENAGRALRGKVRSALTYPVFMGVAQHAASSSSCSPTSCRR